MEFRGEKFVTSNEPNRRYEKMAGETCCPCCHQDKINVFSLDECMDECFVRCHCYNCNTDFYVEPTPKLLLKLDAYMESEIEMGYFPTSDL